MMPTLRQRAANAITAMHAASTMFAMHAMLGRLAAQLKMPRPDAYASGLACRTPFSIRMRCPRKGVNFRSALTRYLVDARLPIDNNHDEQQIRPWATGRKNWLFAGTLAAGKRAAAITSLIQSAKLNGHDPYAYLKDVLERLPTHRASDIDALLPHRWTPATSG